MRVELEATDYEGDWWDDELYMPDDDSYLTMSLRDSLGGEDEYDDS